MFNLYEMFVPTNQVKKVTEIPGEVKQQTGTEGSYEGVCVLHWEFSVKTLVIFRSFPSKVYSVLIRGGN